jgi:hypothetical protein
MRKRTKYLKPEMEFDNALMGYKPKLPENTSKRKIKIEINWLAIVAILLLIFVITLFFALFG